MSAHGRAAGAPQQRGAGKTDSGEDEQHVVDHCVDSPAKLGGGVRLQQGGKARRVGRGQAEQFAQHDAKKDALVLRRRQERLGHLPSHARGHGRRVRVGEGAGERGKPLRTRAQSSASGAAEKSAVAAASFDNAWHPRKVPNGGTGGSEPRSRAKNSPPLAHHHRVQIQRVRGGDRGCLHIRAAVMSPIRGEGISPPCVEIKKERGVHIPRKTRA